ncbi:MAG: NAD-dependent epimerase/dehydratase family protein [Thermodesulfobacteriota bacterium]|nr:NAD-dependent epimerase/dehydratase family protein [Thermodesulfobacteriota bacterium]
MKNILVIGGSYFAGKVFVEEIMKQQDYQIYVMNRGNRPLHFEGVTEIICDRKDVIGITRSVPELSWCAVVDFCAYVPDDVETIVNVLPGSIEHYIYISTTSIYEDSLDLPIREDAPKLAGPQTELGSYGNYAFDKWCTELKLTEKCGEKGIPCTSLRPAIIYGKYNYAPRESYFFDLILNNKTVILPDIELALFQFVSVWDVAEILIECLGNEKVFNNAYNLSAPELVSYRRLVKVLEEITGKRIGTRKLNIPMINQKQIPLPFPLDQHLIYSGELIQRVLNFQYTPFVEGMRKTFEHYCVSID